MAEVSDGTDRFCFPEINISCKKENVTDTYIVVNRIMLSCISVLTVALNLLVIISVSHFRTLHTPTNLLLLSLAVSDFTVGLIVFPSEIFKNTNCWYLGDFLCSFFNYVTSLTISSSVGHMVMISADRYAAICDPLHYPTRITVSSLKLCICVCWLFSGLYSSLIIYGDFYLKFVYLFCFGMCILVLPDVAGMIDLILVVIAPVIIIIILYMRIFVVAVSQARAMRSHIKAVSRQHSETLTSRKSELKAARTLGVLVFVFLICYIPHYAVSLAGGTTVVTQKFLIYLFFLNSCINPVIYALLYPWFRKSVKLIVTLQILKSGSREANIL